MGDEASTQSQTGKPAVDPAAAKPKAPGRDPVLTERDQLLARMDAQIEERRKAEEEEFLASAGEDPAAWALYKRMQAEAGTPIDKAPPEVEDRTPTEAIDEAPPEVEDETPTQPIAAPAKVVKPAERVSTKGEDPLGDYVVRVNGKPMFKTLVDGQEKLIPLEAARAQLQKHLAADVRLQQAAAQRRENEARAAQLQKTEAELRARSTATRVAPIEDEALDRESVELVRSLVTEPEDKAAAKLAKTLKMIRQAQAPQIDVEAIRQEAVNVAKQTLAEDKAKTALESGFETFTRDYQDIASDPELFAIADRKTEILAQEHPEWSPGQLMMEAGKQTREWMQSLGLTSKKSAGQPPVSNRQQRKEGLRPMPAPRTARPAQAPAESEGRQSAADVVAEMRKARGQFS